MADPLTPQNEKSQTSGSKEKGMLKSPIGFGGFLEEGERGTEEKNEKSCNHKKKKRPFEKMGVVGQ